MKLQGAGDSAPAADGAHLRNDPRKTRDMMRANESVTWYGIADRLDSIYSIVVYRLLYRVCHHLSVSCRLHAAAASTRASATNTVW